MKHLLEVADLCVTYTDARNRKTIALSGVSFAVEQGEILGVLGESGSGKSTLAGATIGVLHPSGKMEKGAVWFDGQNLVRAAPRELQKIHGARIGTIFQEPQLALHPCIRVGEQVGDVLAAHRSMSQKALREETLRILSTVFSEEVERIANAYPHQLSGGQRARALVAQAIVCQPALLIADEPTASLDPVTQAEVIAAFRVLQKEHRLAMVLITHSPALLAGLADRIAVLYAGRVVEIGPAESVLANPCHPYTRDLLRCVPPLIDSHGVANEKKLPIIREGMAGPMAGKCVFEARCDDRMGVCATREPATVSLTETHNVACFKYGG
jgi:oligopeptide/dipeptide ABC transporter ATP-binding protein